MEGSWGPPVCTEGECLIPAGGPFIKGEHLASCEYRVTWKCNREQKSHHNHQKQYGSRNATFNVPIDQTRQVLG